MPKAINVSPIQMKVRFRSTDGLRKYARDTPRGRKSRKKYDPEEHDELIARRERIAAEIRARQQAGRYRESTHDET